VNRVDLDNFPSSLRSMRHFVLYQMHKQNGEVKKRPYDWLGGTRGNDNPDLRLHFDEAVNKVRGRADLGVAIYQPEGGTRINIEEKIAYLHIIDCDGFIAEVKGKREMLPCGWDIIDKSMNSYTEETVSGIGFKIFVLSDLEPQTKRTFKMPPNPFAVSKPDIKKYSTSHAVEVFSKNFWNVITGCVVHSDCTELKFLPKTQLTEVFTYLESLVPKVEADPIRESGTPTREFQNKAQLINALSRIDNQSEGVWNDVAYSLARVTGPSGIDLFLAYSRGDYNGLPYAGYSEVSVNARYARALLEVQKKPAGFGLAHLSKLSGIPISAIAMEMNSSVSLSGITAAELSTKEFPPLEWVVDGILPEGSYLLSARPKVGKSWLALQICLAVAYGEQVLGREVKQGKAIYLALEDNERRLQSRLWQLRPAGFVTHDLILHTKWPRFKDGGVEALIKAIEEYKPRVVVIDTLAKVRTPNGRNSGIYEADYATLAPLTEVANRYRTTILIIHHNRKGKAETDPLEQISGSLGLAGAVDGALIIDGNRGDPSYNLSLIGRDIPNDDDLAISLQNNGRWVVLGAAKEIFISTERQAVKELLILHPGGLKPSEVADLTGKKAGGVRKLMNAMAKDGQLINAKGVYSLPTLSSDSGNCSVESNGGSESEVGNSGNSGNRGNSGNNDTDGNVDSVKVSKLPQLPALHG